MNTLKSEIDRDLLEFANFGVCRASNAETLVALEHGRGPSLVGLGKRPSLTPCHHVDLDTGIGPFGARICFILTRPVFGNSMSFIVLPFDC